MKKEKEKKRKEKSIGAKPNFTTIHVSLKMEEDVEMHRMM